MKFDRKLCWIKPAIEFALNKFNIQILPDKIEIMKHLPHKPIKQYSYTCRGKYNTKVVKVRIKHTINGNTIRRTREEIIQNVCTEIAALNHIDDIVEKMVDSALDYVR